jgi:hypothetical protein
MTIQSPPPDTGAAVFEVERFEWTSPDRLELEGRWSGVRGKRFMRPTLTLHGEGRQHRLLALLEHKPWAAEDQRAWIAAFPWDGEPIDADDAALSVGAGLNCTIPPPQVPGGRHTRAARPNIARAQAVARVREAERMQRERDAALAERDATIRARDALLDERDVLRRERDTALHELERARQEAEDAALAARDEDRGELEAERRRHDATRRELDQLRAEHETLAAQHGALERERDSVTRARDSALRERDTAARALELALSERDLAERDRDTARAERAAAERARDLVGSGHRRAVSTGTTPGSLPPLLTPVELSRRQSLNLWFTRAVVLTAMAIVVALAIAVLL